MTKQSVNIACVIGTRPEVIKMAPVIAALKKNKDYRVHVINSAQHRDLVDDLLTVFDITPDVDLDIMSHNQSLATLTGQLFLKLEKVLTAGYDLIIAQGDTTTTWVAAQIAFYHHILFAHVEAGLRSYDMRHPFPEEMNRVYISKIASWHFAPTEEERKILIKEGVPEKNIFVTGNTGIDSLMLLAKKNTPLPIELDPIKKLILVTMHRRESFGEPVKEIFAAFLALIQQFPDIEIVFPVHPNPNIRALAHTMLKDQPQIKMIEPVRYDVFVSLLKQAYLILTDSGGIQEEAPALNKPILVLRDVTERPLIIKLGMGRLVGTNQEKLITAVTELLTHANQYRAMQKAYSPYGDGKAAERILAVINRHFSKKSVLTS